MGGDERESKRVFRQGDKFESMHHRHTSRRHLTFGKKRWDIIRPTCIGLILTGIFALKLVA